MESNKAWRSELPPGPVRISTCCHFILNPRQVCLMQNRSQIPTEIQLSPTGYQYLIFLVGLLFYPPPLASKLGVGGREWGRKKLEKRAFCSRHVEKSVHFLEKQCLHVRCLIFLSRSLHGRNKLATELCLGFLCQLVHMVTWIQARLYSSELSI